MLVVEVGDKLYRFSFGKLLEYTVVKVSWRSVVLRYGREEFKIPKWKIDKYYFTTREKAIEKYIKVLRAELETAKDYCKTVEGLQKELEKWEKELNK